MKKALLAAAIAAFSLSAVAKDDLQYSKAIDQSLKSGKIAYFIEGKKGAGEKNNAVCEDGLFFNDHYLAVFDGATDKSGKSYDGKKADGSAATSSRAFSRSCRQTPIKRKS